MSGFHDPGQCSCRGHPGPPPRRAQEAQHLASPRSVTAFPARTGLGGQRLQRVGDNGWRLEAAAAKVPLPRRAIGKRVDDLQGFVVLPRRWRRARGVFFSQALRQPGQPRHVASITRTEQRLRPVEHDASPRTATMDGIDPSAGEIRQEPKSSFPPRATWSRGAPSDRAMPRWHESLCRPRSGTSRDHDPGVLRRSRLRIPQDTRTLIVAASPRACRPFLPVRASARMSTAFALRPSASSSLRYASSPASEVTPDPRNWRISRRPKSRRRASPLNSPGGPAIAASIGSA
jgi:hypothetical protein